ncbi:MAG TPA: hypothetical protein VG052_07610 [Puia sp.]|jgi:hypothetical protein|nr:hypothetical protein [Puia sp.]
MKSFFNAAFGKLIFGTFFLLSVATAHAQSTVPGAVPATDSATVRYLGMQDDMLIFNVSYDNPKGNKFVVAVKDQDGTQLYQNIFRDKAFYKQFKLPKTDKDEVIFVIRNGQDAPIVKTFAVNIDSRFVQEVAIKKL